MRTLLVSDLHLGQRPRHDVLRLAAARERLLDALDDVDRLILLGDVVELASRRRRTEALTLAAPVLGAIGRRMGPEREVVLVPGNHDSVLVRDWVRERGGALGLDDEVPLDATPWLAAVVAMLSPARVRVRYPGVWVREDVWATHGHYIDRHLAPESTFGLPRGRLRHPTAGARPEDYERARRRRARRRREAHERRSALRERPVAIALEAVVTLVRRAARLLRDAQLAALASHALDLQARHAAMPAAAHVAGRLDVGARWIVFGHIHRAGPGAGGVWQPWPDAPQLLNTGSWVHEPVLLAGSGPRHPYWPGTAVRVCDGADPEVLHLLGDLDGAQLSGSAVADPDRSRPSADGAGATDRTGGVQDTGAIAGADARDPRRTARTVA